MSLFKTPRFVGAPRKTLAQCLRIMNAAVAHDAAAATAAKSSASSLDEPFNAIVFSSPRFGLTIKEVNAALPACLAYYGGPPLTFRAVFLPSDEIVVIACPTYSGASVEMIISESIATPVDMEWVLTVVRPTVARVVQEAKLAGAVSLAYVDDDGVVVRREGGSAATAGRLERRRIPRVQEDREQAGRRRCRRGEEGAELVSSPQEIRAAKEGRHDQRAGRG